MAESSFTVDKVNKLSAFEFFILKPNQIESFTQSIEIGGVKLRTAIINNIQIFYDPNFKLTDDYTIKPLHGTDFILHTKNKILTLFNKNGEQLIINFTAIKEINFDDVKLLIVINDKTTPNSFQFYNENATKNKEYKMKMIHQYYLLSKIKTNLNILFNKDFQILFLNIIRCELITWGNDEDLIHFIVITDTTNVSKIYNFDGTIAKTIKIKPFHGTDFILHTKNKILILFTINGDILFNNFTDIKEIKLGDVKLLMVTYSWKIEFYNKDTMKIEYDYTKKILYGIDFFLHTKDGIKTLFTEDGQTFTKGHASFSEKLIGKNNYIIATNADGTNTLYTLDLKNKIKNYTGEIIKGTVTLLKDKTETFYDLYLIQIKSIKVNEVKLFLLTVDNQLKLFADNFTDQAEYTPTKFYNTYFILNKAKTIVYDINGTKLVDNITGDIISVIVNRTPLLLVTVNNTSKLFTDKFTDQTEYTIKPLHKQNFILTQKKDILYTPDGKKSISNITGEIKEKPGTDKLLTINVGGKVQDYNLDLIAIQTFLQKHKRKIIIAAPIASLSIVALITGLIIWLKKRAK